MVETVWSSSSVLSSTVTMERHFELAGKQGLVRAVVDDAGLQKRTRDLDG